MMKPRPEITRAGHLSSVGNCVKAAYGGTGRHHLIKPFGSGSGHCPLCPRAKKRCENALSVI